MMPSFLCLLAGLGSSAAALPVQGTLRAGDHDLTLRHGGRARSYHVHVPRRLTRPAPDLVAAIVPVGGSMVTAGFTPSRPVSVLHIHSVDDPRALYAGGEGPPFPGTNRRSRHTNVLETVQRWAAFNGCLSEPL